MRTQRFLLLALALAGAPEAPAQTLFSQDAHYPSGVYPRYADTGDLDGDGLVDVVVTDSNGSALHVFLGDGVGGLRPWAVVPLSGAPRGISLGDLDGDGDLDAAVVLPGSVVSGTVLTLWGDGAGGLTVGDSTTVGGFPVWVEVGDLDGDGLLDLVVGSQTFDQVTVHLGTGGGAFAAPSVVPVGASVEELALGDLEGDGDLDLFVCSWLDSQVVWLLGDGSGGFTMGGSRFAPSVRSFDVADLDGDGMLDVVAVSSTTGLDTVRVYLAGPGGALGLPSAYVTGDTPLGVAVSDMNSDGVPDVSVACRGSNTIDLLVGTGEGVLASTIESPVSHSPEFLLTAHLDGDGIPDLIATEPLTDSVGVYLGDGVGSYVRYCDAQTTAQGCLPRLEAWGTPSVTNLSPFFIYVGDMQENQTAMFAYAVRGQRADVPFLGGTLCIGPGGLLRTPPVNTGEDPDLGGLCTGRAFIEFNGFALGQGGGFPHPDLVLVGTTYRVQLWSRDPLAPSGANLSSALEVMPWL